MQPFNIYQAPSHIINNGNIINVGTFLAIALFNLDEFIALAGPNTPNILVVDEFIMKINKYQNVKLNTDILRGKEEMGEPFIPKDIKLHFASIGISLPSASVAGPDDINPDILVINAHAINNPAKYIIPPKLVVNIDCNTK